VPEGVKVFALQLVESDDDDRRLTGGSEEFGGVGGEAQLVDRVKFFRQFGHLREGKATRQRRHKLLYDLLQTQSRQ